jgi:hypothetical protein
MDPSLEQSAFWSSFHTRLMVAIADALDGQLFPNYYVDVESRTYLEDDGSELLVDVPDALVLAPRSEVEPLEKEKAYKIDRSVRDWSPGRLYSFLCTTSE